MKHTFFWVLCAAAFAGLMSSCNGTVDSSPAGTGNGGGGYLDLSAPWIKGPGEFAGNEFPRNLTAAVSDKRPLFIVSTYATDLYKAFSENKPRTSDEWFEAKQSPVTLWKLIPDDIKPYTVLLIHGNQFTTDKNTMKNWYDEQLSICDNNSIPALLMVIAAYGYKDSSYPGYAFNFIDPKGSDEQWIDDMTAKHPSLSGWVSSEHYWTGVNPNGHSAKWLQKAGEKNKVFFVHDGHNYSKYFWEGSGAEPWKTAVKQYGGTNLVFGYKYTQGTDILGMISNSHGLWLNAQNFAFGGLFDTWSWHEKGYDQVFGPVSVLTRPGWHQAAMYPEGLMAAHLLTMYMNGATVFNFEAPWIVFASKGRASEYMTNIIFPFLRFVIEHPAPTKEEMLDATKIICLGNKDDGSERHPDMFQNLNEIMYKSGRYGLLSVYPESFGEENLAGELKTRIDDKRIALYKPNAGTSPVQSDWEKAYPRQTLPLDTGKIEAAAVLRNTAGTGKKDMWLLYNYAVNPSEGDAKKQYVKIPLTADNSKTLEAELTPHTAVMVKKVSDTVLNIWMTNYRIDKSSVFEELKGLKYSREDIERRDEIYRETICDNPDTSRWKRDTIFTVSGAAGVFARIIDCQSNSRSDIRTDENGTEHVITVSGNGWVRFTVAVH